MHQPFTRPVARHPCPPAHPISKIMPDPRKKNLHPLHRAVVLCSVTMVEKCSLAPLYASAPLDATVPGTDAAKTSHHRRDDGPGTRTSGRRVAPSAAKTVPGPQRARFDPRHRQQVADVRKRGACMRCRVKKLPVGAAVPVLVAETSDWWGRQCSGSWPCESCRRSQAVFRATFDRWEQCVSFSMKEVNIYVIGDLFDGRVGTISLTRM